MPHGCGDHRCEGQGQGTLTRRGRRCCAGANGPTGTHPARLLHSDPRPGQRDRQADRTIIDGWQSYQLENYMKTNFGTSMNIVYQDILADTYKYKSTDTLDKIIRLMYLNKDQLFNNYDGNILLNEYSINEIMTIASLVEREGIDDNDKKLISSVIFNRLNKNMKLQIDASTIFSITRGKFKFTRKLKYKDLRIKDIYNTYFIYGLPPNPICYVGSKTIEMCHGNDPASAQGAEPQSHLLRDSIKEVRSPCRNPAIVPLRNIPSKSTSKDTLL